MEQRNKKADLSMLGTLLGYQVHQVLIYQEIYWLVKAQFEQVKEQLELGKIFNATLFYQNERKFNVDYSRSNLPKVKDAEYLMNLEGYKSLGTHWINLYMNGNKATYLNSLGVKHILKEIKKIKGNKYIITNMYRVQT